MKPTGFIKTYFRKRFSHPCASTKRHLTSPLVSSAHASQLGLQSFSVHTNVPGRVSGMHGRE
jgi:hypothetical protein